MEHTQESKMDSLLIRLGIFLSPHTTTNNSSTLVIYAPWEGGTWTLFSSPAPVSPKRSHVVLSHTSEPLYTPLNTPSTTSRE